MYGRGTISVPGTAVREGWKTRGGEGVEGGEVADVIDGILTGHCSGFMLGTVAYRTPLSCGDGYFGALGCSICTASRSGGSVDATWCPSRNWKGLHCAGLDEGVERTSSYRVPAGRTLKRLDHFMMVTWTDT